MNNHYSPSTKQSHNFGLWIKLSKLNYYINQDSGWGNAKEKDGHLVYWRRILAFVSSLIQYPKIASLLNFYIEDELVDRIISKHTCILEQMFRNWYYYRSTTKERTQIQKFHFCFLKSELTQKMIETMYLENGIDIWSHSYLDQSLKVIVNFERIHRKEGLLSVTLKYGEMRLYLSTFWIAPGLDGLPAIWIGSLQGTKGGLEIIQKLTKHFFGYRTKNLLLFTLRMLARELNIKSIYAVSNYGFQASHHLYANRRLKTSLDEFWRETGGSICEDKRFYALPLVEHRKSIEEIVSHKRNLYNKRFALLDEVANQIHEVLQLHLNEK